MLKTVDRIQMVVPDRAAAARNWQKLVGAVMVGEDSSRLLNAHRTTIQIGRSLVELLEPAGDGPVATWAGQWSEGLYGVVFATADLNAMSRHLTSIGAAYKEDAGAFVIDAAATHGMPSSVVQFEERAPVGLLSHLYEVTNPVPDWQQTAGVYTRLFGLDSTTFVPISSAQYGYTGTLTLFEHGKLDRIEITQTSGGGAMDRFFQRRGPSLYMCYTETPDVAALAANLQAAGARYAPSTPAGDEGLFIHPSALNGMLMGVSGPDVAWSWSGGKP